MPGKDYYAILGVSKSASEDEIKKAFRRLAHEHHPDKKGGDDQKFKDVNEAYQVLSDKEKRARYDQFGSAAFENGGFGQGGFGGFGGFDGMNMNMEDFGDLGDILGGMFGFGGNAGRGPKQKRGSDIETEVTIDFLESVKGTRKKISLYTHVACDVCTGSGAEPGSKSETCKTCGGHGAVQRATRTIFGSIQSTVTCPDCHGTGSRPSAVCKHCKGSGVERKTRDLEFDIPAGIASGEALHLQGQGEHPGVGGRPGDLFVRIQVKRHPVFTRENHDVLSTMSVPYSTMSLGGEISVETVDGVGSLKIPEGTTPGTIFKIKGKGFPYLRSNARGDHLVTVQVDVKHRLTKEQRQIIEELRKQGL
jgi:molecular chaperone DnaJ